MVSVSLSCLPVLACCADRASRLESEQAGEEEQVLTSSERAHTSALVVDGSLSTESLKLKNQLFSCGLNWPQRSPFHICWHQT